MSIACIHKIMFMTSTVNRFYQVRFYLLEELTEKLTEDAMLST